VSKAENREQGTRNRDQGTGRTKTRTMATTNYGDSGYARMTNKSQNDEQEPE
jgi:hypothetical protein